MWNTREKYLSRITFSGRPFSKIIFLLSAVLLNKSFFEVEFLLTLFKIFINILIYKSLYLFVSRHFIDFLSPYIILYPYYFYLHICIIVTPDSSVISAQLCYTTGPRFESEFCQSSFNFSTLQINKKSTKAYKPSTNNMFSSRLKASCA